MAWERLCSMLDKAKIVYKSIKAIGRESIYIKGSDVRVEFRTRSSKGGLGEGFDLLVIDEAQEYTDDQESALKYVVSDSKNPQTIFCGTPPTNVSAGTVFVKQRDKTLAGATVNAGWAEWGVEEMSDINDRELWYLTNPSLGTILTERKILDEITSDALDFNIQRLGLWIRYNLKSAISKAEWESLAVKKLPPLKGKLFVGIKYGKIGNHVAMSIACRTLDGKIFVECIDCRDISSGNDWILAFLSEADVKKVVVDGANGQELLEAEMKKEHLGAPLLPTVKQVIVANTSFEQGLNLSNIVHMNQPSLTQSVSQCEKRSIGTNGGFGYKSLKAEVDIALLESVVLAYWACNDYKDNKKQKVTY
jgi:phage terminase large subunit-like protein